MSGLSGVSNSNPEGSAPGGVKSSAKYSPEDLLPKGNSNQFIGRDLDVSSEYLSALFYGDYGAGKSYLAGSAALVPEYRDILYLSLEGGEGGLRQLIKDGEKLGVNVNNHVLVIPISTFKHYSNIYEFIKQHIKFREAGDVSNLRKLEAQIRGYSVEQLQDDALLEVAIPTPKKFKTIITDSLTEAQKYCMYQILGIDPLSSKLDEEPDSAEWKDWGKSREMIQFLVRRLRDLPINSLFICGESFEQDAMKRMHFEPMLPGKLSNDIRGLVSCVGYLAASSTEGGETKRRLYLVKGTYGSNIIAAKHRFGDNFKGSFIEDPTMQKIRDLDSGLLL